MMRILFTGMLLLAGLALVAQNMPKVSRVEPDTGKTGTVLTLTGEGLAKPNVEKVFLTDGKNDFETEIVEHGDTTIKFKITPNVKTGRYSVMFLTGGPAPKYVEEPVKVNVE